MMIFTFLNCNYNFANAIFVSVFYVFTWELLQQMLTLYKIETYPISSYVYSVYIYVYIYMICLQQFYSGFFQFVHLNSSIQTYTFLLWFTFYLFLRLVFILFFPLSYIKATTQTLISPLALRPVNWAIFHNFFFYDYTLFSLSSPFFYHLLLSPFLITRSAALFNFI